MQKRIGEELALIRWRYPEAEYREEGQWVRIPSYPLPDGWSSSTTEVALQIPSGYPGAPPYGIYVPAGLQFKKAAPKNYKEPAGNPPPFPGTWGVFSWTPENGWRATADVRKGSNLLNWVAGFADRFMDGQ